MKKLFIIASVFWCLTACNGNNNSNIPDHAVRDSVRDPSTVQPESEAVPEDMTIKKDSVIVPDSSQIQK